MMDNLDGWIDIGDVADFPKGEVREIVAGEHVLAVAHLDQGIFALDGLCPHQGGPLGKGKISGDIVICPWHQFSFEMPTGYCTTSRGLAQKRYEVKQVGNRVVVLVDTP